MKVRIFLIDDHPVFLDGLRWIIGKQSDLEVVGSAFEGGEALKEIRRLKPDFILADVALPGTDGIEICRRILADLPQVRIVILSGFADDEFVRRSVEAGVHGYLLKGSESAEILRAIRTVASGNTYLSPDITNSVLAASRKYFQARTQPARALLSVREREVLKWIAEGLSTKEIATRLDLGAKTVETYRRRLMLKLGCSRATELVRYALREGIVALD